MNDYRKTINRLQKEIEEKAKELGQTSSIVEELKKERERLGAEITVVQKSIDEKLKEYGNIEDKILEADERLSRATSPHKEKFKTLEEANTYFESLLDVKKSELDSLDEIKAEIEIYRQKKADAEEEYKEIDKKCEAALLRLSQVVRETEEHLKKISEGEKKFEGQNLSLKLQAKNLVEWEENIKFYARRLNKFYVEKNIAFPQDLMERFRPLKYFPSKILKEKLEAKKNLKQIYGTK